MEEDKNKAPLLPISGILLVLAALGVTLFAPPFKPTRPPVPEHRGAYDKVNARLWQDPFSAVLEAAKTFKEVKDAGTLYLVDEPIEGKQKSPEKSNTTGSISIKDSFAKKRRPTVLGVMVPGSPYAEDAETRMRYRYAALSGLSRIGFIPEDAEHIEFVRTYDSTELTLSNIMPFEWVKRANGEKGDDSVLILWMNDGEFEHEPLAKLCAVARFFRNPDKSNNKNFSFKLIGPATSTTLQEMVKDLFSEDSSKALDELEGLEIYSAMATVDNTPLFGDSHNSAMDLPSGEALRKIEEKFQSKHITFKRTIGSDRDLSVKLIDELSLRNVNLSEKSAHIVLIAEWDTLYGRTFLQTFESVLRERGLSPADINRRIHRISYLRGLDGRLPGREEEKKDDKTEATAGFAPDPKKLEQPIGRSQYDYLRRLAEETHQLDRVLESRGEGKVKAVGVLGTDFYDKHLVLQALRQRLSDVVFFTTDMDARLLHPDNIQWTRNVVVASNFGLALKKDNEVDLQGAIPPFRDNYQTSIFFAVLQAFYRDNYLDITNREFIERLPQPLVFEIGRYNAVNLAPGASRDSVHPWSALSTSPGNYVKALAILILLIFFLLSSSTTLATHKGAVIVSFVIFAVFALFMVNVSGHDREEPLSFFEGISVWPTEFLRLAAILISVVFLYSAWRDRKDNQAFIYDKFKFLKEVPGLKRVDKGKENRSFLTRMKEVLRLDWKPSETAKELVLNGLWADYVDHDSDLAHVKRTAIISVLYLLVCGLIISFDPPVSPVRGPISSFVDSVMMGLTVLAFVGLTFYVSSVTRCCRRFIVISSGKFSRMQPDTEDVRERIKKELELVRVIAARTEPIGKLIFYPFIIWLIAFVSRLDYFDNWRTPIGLVVVITMGAVLAWSCAAFLRKSAEEARASSIIRLKELLYGAYGTDPQLIEQIRFVIEEVKSIKRGAFAPAMEHPLVQALFVPFGGVGGVYLIDFFAKMGM